MEALSLFELNEYIRQVILLNFGQEIWVDCEISQLNFSRGHRYLELIQKDEAGEEIIARIAAVIWRGDYAFLRRKHRDLLDDVLAEANQVRLKVVVDYHERFGLKLLIKDIDPQYTLGLFAERRQQIVRRLEAENLLDTNAELGLPAVIQRVAVISSETAAGFADFMAHLRENEYGYDFRVHLFPAAMQGKQVAPEVLAQLSAIKRRKREFDAVVIIRGGGSKVDLADFDHFELGKTIALFPLPVFTGIGHQIDESVIDLVAAASFKTPTAVADFLIRYNLEAEQEVLLIEEKITQLIQDSLREKEQRLIHFEKLIPVMAGNLIERSEWALRQMERDLAHFFSRVLDEKKRALNHLLELIETTKPERILRKGYSITYKDRMPVRNAGDLKPGDEVVTHVFRGKFTSTVKKVN